MSPGIADLRLALRSALLGSGRQDLAEIVDARADLVAGCGLDGRDILRLFELVEEGQPFVFRPLHLVDWAVGGRSLIGLQMMAERLRLLSALPAKAEAASPDMTRCHSCAPPAQWRI